MWWLFRVLFSFVFLFTIVLSIPVVFDVGGRESGLAYSLSLFLFYFFYSAFKLATPPSSRVRWMLGGIIRLSQWVVIPALLVWSLDRFAIDADSNWLEKITGAAEATRNADTWGEYVFGKGGLLQGLTIGGWDVTLRYSSPVFQLLEGFCSLLVIQAAGQITRWLVNRGRSDTWVITLLVFSASIIASAVYFLWRVANFPHISNIDATLIGVTMTSAVFLGAYGIGSGRGNPVESSLLFAYVVLCVYQIFTDYMPSDPAAAAAAAAAEAELDAQQQEFPPLPPAIMASISTLMHFIGTLPSAIHSTLTLLYAAFQTITPSVIISLTYRIIVFYCATRIIPAVREVGARALVDEMADQDDGAGKLLGFLSWFSPSILIAVYTSLLLQHFTTSDGEDGWSLKGGDVGGNTWQWVNVVGTMSLYALELYLGGEDSHWKTD